VRLLVDEGVDARVVTRLRADGHDVTHIAELSPGIGDDAVLAMANTEDRLLLTADKDFGELVFRLRRATVGVLLIRLPGQPSHARAETVSQAVAAYGEQIRSGFAVLSAGTLRIRPRDRR